MKQICVRLALIVLCFSANVEAQPFMYVDATTRSTGIGGGWFFGRGSLQPGVFADIYHANDFDQLAADGEALAALAWSGTRWYAVGSVGGGVVSVGSSINWSVRSFFLLTSSTNVAFRVSLFVQWTPDDGSVFVQPRIGPSFRLGQTRHRIFPNLGLALNVPTDGESVSARLVPGCMVILNL